MKQKLNFGLGLATLAFGIALFGCAPTDDTAGAKPAGENKPEGSAAKLSGTINIDGSSTVFPIAQLLGEDFSKNNPDVKVNVSKSGTGSGFTKFLNGEIDIATASRPIEDKELERAKAKSIEFVEVPIAFDGVSVVVNPANTWATSMTLAELKKAWAADSTVKTWKDINPAWPADAITFVGPTDNHGTYEYFTEAVNGKKNQIRKAYQPNQEYTTIIQAVANDKNTIGYVGFNYLEENTDKVKAVAVDTTLPTVETIADGSYKPLSRPLFLYVSKKAYDRAEVKEFLKFALGDGTNAVVEAKYVKLPQDAYDAVKARVDAGTLGSVFQGITPGMKITDILKKESTK